MNRLVFQAGDREAMSSHVARWSPEEACGLLAGAGEMVKSVFPVTNWLHSSDRFEMDPKEQLAVFNLIERKHLDLVGIFHSHPVGPAIPSPSDVASFSYPGVACLIWSNAAGLWMVQGYLIENSTYYQIELDFPG